MPGVCGGVGSVDQVTAVWVCAQVRQAVALAPGSTWCCWPCGCLYSSWDETVVNFGGWGVFARLGFSCGLHGGYMSMCCVDGRCAQLLFCRCSWQGICDV
jgi:hypothetical protein